MKNGCNMSEKIFKKHWNDQKIVKVTLKVSRKYF